MNIRAKAGNIIFNLVFFLDIAGLTAFALYAWARWPALGWRAISFLSDACAGGAIVLGLFILPIAFIVARITEKLNIKD